MAGINLYDLYKKAFSTVAPPFPAGGAYDLTNLLAVRDVGALFNIPVNSKDLPPEGKVYSQFNEKSMLGTSFRMPVGFRIPGKKDWWKLPNEPIVSMSGGNDIEVTTLNRGTKRGTVKEYLNLEDYTITIRGIAINEEKDDYPEKFFQELRDYTEAGKAVEISCIMTRIHNINLACVQNMNYEGNAALPFRARAYELKVLSDENFELELL